MNVIIIRSDGTEVTLNTYLHDIDLTRFICIGSKNGLKIYKLKTPKPKLTLIKS